MGELPHFCLLAHEHDHEEPIKNGAANQRKGSPHGGAERFGQELATHSDEVETRDHEDQPGHVRPDHDEHQRCG